MKKNVVLINQSTGYLMIDIVNAYAAQYDQVTLIAGSMKYAEMPFDVFILGSSVLYRYYSSFYSSTGVMKWYM